jgi:hypothetical protein
MHSISPDVEVISHVNAVSGDLVISSSNANNPTPLMYAVFVPAGAQPGLFGVQAMDGSFSSRTLQNIVYPILRVKNPWRIKLHAGWPESMNVEFSNAPVGSVFVSKEGRFLITELPHRVMAHLNLDTFFSDTSSLSPGFVYKWNIEILDTAGPGCAWVKL